MTDTNNSPLEGNVLFYTKPEPLDPTLHGALGVSNEMPFMRMVTSSLVMGIADGPTEVHKDTIAKQVVKGYEPSAGLFPTAHLPTRIEEARRKVEERLEHEVGNL